MTDRRCIGCGEIKDRSNLIKITAECKSNNVIINPNSLTFGRSVYLCYNESCIKQAIKKNKVDKFLKRNLSEELKGQLLNELRIN